MHNYFQNSMVKGNSNFVEVDCVFSEKIFSSKNSGSLKNIGKEAFALGAASASMNSPTETVQATTPLYLLQEFFFQIE